MIRGYSKDSMFIEDNQKYSDLITNKVKLAIKKTIGNADQIFIPLGYGGHIDHLIARDSATNIIKTKYYYGEIPYVLREISLL